MKLVMSAGTLTLGTPAIAGKGLDMGTLLRESMA